MKKYLVYSLLCVALASVLMFYSNKETSEVCKEPDHRVRLEYHVRVEPHSPVCSHSNSLFSELIPSFVYQASYFKHYCGFVTALLEHGKRLGKPSRHHVHSWNTYQYFCHRTFSLYLGLLLCDLAESFRSYYFETNELTANKLNEVRLSE